MDTWTTYPPGYEAMILSSCSVFNNLPRVSSINSRLTEKYYLSKHTKPRITLSGIIRNASQFGNILPLCQCTQ
jgi:hypothetical protein